MEKSLLKADLLRSMGLVLEQAECFYMIFVKLREREGQRVDLGRSLKDHL